MVPKTSIMAAIDLSDGARYAAERAAMVAKEQCANLSLIHVMSRSALSDLRKLFHAPTDVQAKLIDDAKHTLNEIAEDLSSKTGVMGRTDVKTGHVQAEILSTTESADLLVLGAHGGSSLHGVMLGTTAERLLSTCKRPVLVVKSPPKIRYQHVLVPVDFSPYSASAIAMASQIAPHAHLTILHVFRIPFEGRLQIVGASESGIRRYCEEEQEAAARQMRELIRQSQVDSNQVSYRVERGDPSPVILATAEELLSDLIVIGKHGQSWFEELFLGSVTHHILARSTCDTLVVHK